MFFLSFIGKHLRSLQANSIISTYIFSVRVTMLFFDQIYILRRIQEPRVSCDHAALADFPASSELLTTLEQLKYYDEINSAYKARF